MRKIDEIYEGLAKVNKEIQEASADECFEMFQEGIGFYVEMTEALAAENRKLRGALEFYADSGSWEKHEKEERPIRSTVPVRDFEEFRWEGAVGGKLARKVLKEIK